MGLMILRKRCSAEEKHLIRPPQVAALIKINVQFDLTIIVGRALADRFRGHAVPVGVRGPASSSRTPPQLAASFNRHLAGLPSFARHEKETAPASGRDKLGPSLQGGVPHIGTILMSVRRTPIP